MKIGAWLLALIEPMIAKILIAVGFSLVSIVGVNTVVQQLKSQLHSTMGSLSGDILGLFLLAGGGTGLGMVMGAITTRLLLWQAQKATQFLGKAPN